MPHINCRNTVRDLYGITKKKHQFIADMSYRQFKKQVCPPTGETAPSRRALSRARLPCLPSPGDRLLPGPG
eukprot:COSAG01_NODE_7727_length_3082_cov_2.513577_1_plen_70_part_10